MQTTQCPNCQTRFNVTDQQLSMAGGRVRCGRCSHVFNAREQIEQARRDAALLAEAAPRAGVMQDFRLELPPEPAKEAPASSPAAVQADVAAVEAPPVPTPVQAPAPAPVEPAAPPIDHEFSQALSEALRPTHEPDAERGAAPARRRLSLYDEVASEPQAPPAPEPEPFVADRTRYEPSPEEVEERLQAAERPERRPARRSGLGVLFGLFAVLGLLVLAGQVVYLKRVEIAAQAPEWRPTLEAACKPFHCTVPLATDVQYIRTEWSEMAFVPEHANLIQLNATLKNHAGYVQGYPMLELSLKDADDQVQVRRVLTPAEYLKNDDVQLGRFNPHSEVKLSLRLDVGNVHPSGYSLHWFYP
ncbi:DUF3426 domain-containing protein [Crenobacter sp. SG2305]|uniref:DUF3426 domain-containing protein n=1 Tax=Crenobacter oryzisoli TaxID=3056844 RepID=UPI0025AA6FB5|nr:DUF3426 domain-containing protein [Crenobacter sp. SG2305]MDN0084385.1 DUF3426 domain-containing protein [Crenobacter sp. SG2305]